MGEARKAPLVAIFDVDGVMTDGMFHYSDVGKVLKRFGPDDADALKALKKFIDIRFISADKRGYPITRARIVRDMGMKLDLVSGRNRLEWIEENYRLDEVVYMGDGFHDHKVLKSVNYGIAPANADFNAIKEADYVTIRKGGDRAVAEACVHIYEEFFSSERCESLYDVS